MIKVFQYNNDTGKVELSVPEITLVTEFKALMSDKRNICPEDKKGTKRLRAFKEFTYIWLAIDWQSVYSDYIESEKHELALKDSGLTQEEFDDPTFRAACRKYRDMQNETRSMKALKAAQGVIDKVVLYFNNIDLEERDEETNKPIWKVKDIQTELTNLEKVLESLKSLETIVRKDLAETSTIRAGAEEGYTPNI